MKPNKTSRILLLVVMLLSNLIAFAGGTNIVQEGKISITANSKSVKEILNMIEREGTYRFLYDDNLQEMNNIVSINVKNETIGNVLDKVLKNTNLVMQSMDNNLIVITTKEIVKATAMAKAENNGKTTDNNSNVSFKSGTTPLSVKGKVIDSKTGEPISYVSVIIKEENKKGVVTDENGNFVIKPSDENYSLIFSFIGYKTEEIKINGRTIINMVLESESTVLSDVMVVAYGTAKKESFTGSAQVVKSDKLAKRTVTDITKALDGMIAGIQSTSGSGQPGAGSTIVIRGFGSINASAAPLYVVDGIPYDGSINAINPSDIESMTILKDASAGALYGSRGANGVIIITTKKGQESAVKINFKGSWGVSSRAIPRYATLDSYGWVESVYQSYKNKQIQNGVAPSLAGQAALNEMISGASKVFGTDAKYNPFNTDVHSIIDFSTGKVKEGVGLKWNDDWLDAATKSNPMRNEYVLSLSGGDATTKYMFSLGYLNEEGLVDVTNFDRYSGRMNIESQLKKWVKAGMNLNVAKTDANTTSSGSADMNSSSYLSNVFYSAMLMAPIYPIYEKDDQGKNLLDEEGNKIFDYGVSRPSGASPSWNSIATMHEDKYSTNDENVSGRTFMDIGGLKEGPLKGLKFTTSFGFDYINQKLLYYYNPYNGEAVDTKGSIYIDNYKTFSYTFNQLINYNRSFGKHSIDFLAGHEFYKKNVQYFGGQKNGFPFGGLYEMADATTVVSVNSYQDNYAIESLLSRLNYNFANKYYLSASFRRDASSRFYTDNRWGNFWSVGGSWRISEENFMKDISFVNNLTMKGSYGIQGNDNIGTYYAWQAFYDLGYPNASNSGALVSSLENKDLKWEKNGNLNIGVEARLFNRLSLSAEWYNRKTSDMLMSYPMAVSLGFAGYNKNIGKMQNQGFEISVSEDLINKPDTKLTLTWMGSTIKNKVLSLTDNKNEIISDNYIIKVGEPLNSFYLAKSAGVDPATGDQLYRVWDENADGSRRYYISNSYAKATACKEIMGSRIPDIYGSISTDFKYKNFDMSILTTYSIGGKIYDNVYRSMLLPNYSGQAASVDRAKAWANPGDITRIPRIDIGGRYITTDDALFDASYFSIKNVSIGYSIPQKWIRPLKFDSIRVSLTGDNLWLFSALKGMDPQYNFNGSTGFVYTSTKTISIGLDINF